MHSAHTHTHKSHVAHRLFGLRAAVVASIHAQNPIFAACSVKGQHGQGASGKWQVVSAKWQCGIKMGQRITFFMRNGSKAKTRN